LNDPRLVRAREAGGLGLHAVWDDDVHHALHASLTGERAGYYVDFGPLPVLAKALTSVYVHDGTYSTFRGRRHGRPAGDLPGSRFVTFLQDHDQVGNRAAGERLAHLTSPGLARVGALLLLTAPYVPMLFMGEEWAASTPWLFFSDYADPALGAAVTEGRRREFADHGWDSSDVPDPQDPRTWRRSVLAWEERDRGEHAAMLDLYRRLIALRRAIPALRDGRRDRCTVAVDPAAGTLLMFRGGSRDVAVAANVSDSPATVELPTAGEIRLATSAGGTITGRRLVLPAESGTVVSLASGPSVSGS
jgi:maltooligosyltrehalose trehalohydrolase